jgi:hypothetical protein
VRLVGTVSSAVVSVIDSIQLVTQTDEYRSRNMLYQMVEVYGLLGSAGEVESVESQGIDLSESIPPQFQEKIRDGGLPIWWHQFAGQGQRPTPVTSPKGVLEILALAPLLPNTGSCPYRRQEVAQGAARAEKSTCGRVWDSAGCYV